MLVFVLPDKEDVADGTADDNEALERDQPSEVVNLKTFA